MQSASSCHNARLRPGTCCRVPSKRGQLKRPERTMKTPSLQPCFWSWGPFWIHADLFLSIENRWVLKVFLKNFFLQRCHLKTTNFVIATINYNDLCVHQCDPLVFDLYQGGDFRSVFIFSAPHTVPLTEQTFKMCLEYDWMTGWIDGWKNGLGGWMKYTQIHIY